MRNLPRLVGMAILVSGLELPSYSEQPDVSSREFAVVVTSGKTMTDDAGRVGSREIGVLFSDSASAEPSRELAVLVPSAQATAATSRTVSLKADASRDGFVASRQVTIAIGNRVSHVSREWTIVQRTADPVQQLRVTARSPTSIALEWSAPLERSGVAGYRVFRSPGADRSIHGDSLLMSPRFVDIGLSAGRTYGYEVCAVSEGGIEGKRVRIVTSTRKARARVRP